MMSSRGLLLIFSLSFGVLWAGPQRVGEELTTLHYEMQPGDSLGSVAQFYGLPASHLAATNELTEAGALPDEVRLQVPVLIERPSGIIREAREYEVLPGDTLTGISAMYGLDLLAVVLKNSLENVNQIEVGQTLLMPSPAEARALMNGELPIPDAPPPGLSAGKQVIVDLSQQRVYAYENAALLRVFIVSTGLPRTPTVQGDYEIDRQLENRHMTGPGYDLPDVPFVSYFYLGYAFHGTYWHNNFGTPMSHGCVNMRTEDAHWLYEWLEIGTAVRVTP